MENPDQPSLTAFLLELTESEELFNRFEDDPDEIIGEWGLEDHRKVLLSRNVKGLRDAVWAEVTSKPRGDAPPWEDLNIIRGIRRPP